MIRFRPAALLMPAALLAACAPSTRPGTAGAAPDAARTARLDRGIGELFALGLSPGMSVAVIRGGDVVYMKGFGQADRERGTAVTPETEFYIASSTKAFTGLAAAILAREGVIDLDVPLSRYLPEVRFKPPLSADAITLRQLLTHTHGISNDGPIVFRTAYSGEHTPEMLVQLLAEQPAAEQGRAFRYGNLGYNIASLAIDRAVKGHWQDVLQTRIFAPLGMRSTSARLSTLDRTRLAMPYSSIDSGFVRIPYAKGDENMHAAGGIISTAADLARWVEANLNQGRIDGRQAIPAAAVADAQRLQVRHSERSDAWPRHGYALGWQVGTHGADTLVHHFGGFPGFGAHVSFMPARGVGVVALANGGFDQPLIHAAARYAYDVMTGNDSADVRLARERSELARQSAAIRERIGKNRAERAARSQVLPHPLSAYAGTYEHPLYGRLTLRVDGNRLVATIGRLASVTEVFRGDENALRIELEPGQGEVLRFAFDGASARSVEWSGRTFQRVGDDGLSWQPSWPGTHMVVMKGNPYTGGDWTFRFKMPGGYWIHPHRHPVDARVLVMSGAFLAGHGEKLDSANVQTLSPGERITLQRGMAH